MTSNRVNARLTEPLARHVARVVGPEGIYETPSEYIRSLIRRDMESETYQIYNAILEGFQDIEEKRFFKGSGDFKKDMAVLSQKEASNWNE